MRTLLDLKLGEHSKITNIKVHGEVRKRMFDLGIIRGEDVSLIRKAPLGDPIEIRINRILVSLRKEEARFVLIE